MNLTPICDIFRRTDTFTSIAHAVKSVEPGKPLLIEGIAPSSFPLITAALFDEFGVPIVYVTDSFEKMSEARLDLTSMINESRVSMFPPWETIPYEFISPSESTERERIATLYRIMRGDPILLVTTVEAIMRRIPARSFYETREIRLETGKEYSFDGLIELLISYGYTREKRVDAFGQFAVKGGIIDIYPPAHELPLRLDFFGETLESIREFNLETQASQSELPHAAIYPRKELVLFPRERDIIMRAAREAAASGRELPEIFISQSDNSPEAILPGSEDLFPLAVPTATLISYLPHDAIILLAEPAELSAKRSEIESTFTVLFQRRHASTLCLPPEELLDISVLDRIPLRAALLQTFTTTTESIKPRLRSVQGFSGRLAQARDEIQRRRRGGWSVVITTAFEGQARRLRDLFADLDPSEGYETFTGGMDIILSPLSRGIELEPCRVLIITDHEIFGKSYRKRSAFKKKTSRPIESFLDLKPGDYVVHINHGIGIFSRIERMSAGGVERDFLIIEYAEGDRLYVPLDQITMVQRYIGIEGRRPRLDRLGKKSSWNRVKEKVRESVEEIAAGLMKIHTARMSMKGFPFPPDTVWQEEFEALFEYEETPDQITAIEDVKDDMESPRPMDRLICGDVGFGKTEVAIRASFKAVMAGRQVAVLVPTTVLAMQHYDTFTRRFAGYPIEIEMVSRFRSPSEIARIRKRLAEGGIDIVIGTHALLSKNITIKNLGLLIIDEEQRFGVRHKERLKQFRALVDVLTMTATPIPRTLHMAMAGIRDLSLIMTPPEHRQPIETYVLEENPELLQTAIMNEIGRGGQVFYVHNRVKTIEAQAEMIRKLVPKARVCVAHGQLPEHRLEEVMIDFLARRFDVLVSTSIIESGLDMPNVNTIIINRADTFGLSQLYQLRGRVGRSAMKAYAYLFYPKHRPLSEETMKRLNVIAEYADLGSGFKIAMKDLEIRGAGNILGLEQSGNIYEVGFDLYLQMLDEAVRIMKGEAVEQVFRTPVFLKTDFYIPDEYVPDERQKIELYKRLESCDTEEDIDQVERDMVDRFGRCPSQVRILVEIEKIRAIASRMAIDEILEVAKAIRIRISGGARINVHKALKRMQADTRLSLDPSDKQTIIFSTEGMDPEKKVNELKKLLQHLS